MLIRILLFAAACLGSAVTGASGALPDGFQEDTVVSGLSLPTGLTFAPDGRLFVLEKTGTVRIVKNGALLATPFLDVAQVVAPPAAFNDEAERGLLGIAFDPGFPDAPFVYVYYSVCEVPGPGSCQVFGNRVGRVSAGYQGDPDRADPMSHEVLLDGIAADSGIHNAGWLGFGPLDGKLYVSVGDGGTSTRSGDLGSLNGKILRLEPLDGAAPPDNPFVGLSGARPEVWALGFRNPWRCRFHPDGRLFCGDVGSDAFEELNRVLERGNYGWPITEGSFDPADYPDFTQPIYAYDRTLGSSITAGDFGSETNFPGDYQQSFFFGDYAWRRIRRAILASDGVTVLSVVDFEYPGAGSVTDLVAGPDGALYYTDLSEFSDSSVRRIRATGTNQSPVARASATPSQGQAPLVVQFTSAGSTDADGDPLSFLWDFGDGETSTAEAPSHTYTAPGPYTATLTVSDGRSPIPGTDTVTLPISVGTPPEVTITQPAAGSLFQGGQTIALAGSAEDFEDGTLPASSLHWEVRFHHADHWHPYLNDLVGSPQSFATATSGETASDVSYRIILRATDSSGLTGEASLYIQPRTVTLRIETDPPGLQVTLDGQPRTSPVQVVGVTGVTRTIGAPPSQGAYTFDRWSDGGARIHTITTPAADATYTATFNGPTTTTTVTTSTTSTTILPPTTTSTAPATTSTTSTTSSTSSTSTAATTSSTTTTTTASTTSSTGPSTSSTTAPTTTTTTTSATTSSTNSSTTPSSTTTSTTLVPPCPPSLTPQAVGCRIEGLGGEIAAASSDLGRLAPSLGRRIDRAAARVERAAALCDAGRLSRARAALRGALRYVQTALAKIRSRAGRNLIPAEVATRLERSLALAAGDVKTLRGALVCP